MNIFQEKRVLARVLTVVDKVPEFVKSAGLDAVDETDFALIEGEEEGESK